MIFYRHMHKTMSFSTTKKTESILVNLVKSYGRLKLRTSNKVFGSEFEPKKKSEKFFFYTFYLIWQLKHVKQSFCLIHAKSQSKQTCSFDFSDFFMRSPRIGNFPPKLLGMKRVNCVSCMSTSPHLIPNKQHRTPHSKQTAQNTSSQTNSTEAIVYLTHSVPGPANLRSR